MTRKILPLLCSCLILQTGSAQRTRIDSLEQLLAETTDDSLRSYRSLELVALYYLFSLDTAMVYAEKGLEYAMAAGSERMELSSYANIAAIKSYMNDWEGAVETYYRALERTKALKLHSGTARILTNLSIMYMERKEFDKARELLLQAVPEARLAADPYQLGNTYLNLSKWYFDTHQLDSSTHYAQTAYDIFLESEDLEGQATALSNMAANYIDSKQFAKGIEVNNKAIQINLALQDYFSLPNGFRNQGEAYKGLKNYPVAIEMVHQGLKYAHLTGRLSDLEGCYEMMADIQEQAGRLDSALYYTRQYYETKDSLNRQLNEEKVLEIETKFETQEARNQVTAQQLTIARQQNQQKNILLGGGGLLLLLLAGFQYFRNRQNRRRKEAALALQMERSEAEKLRELDRLKSIFFANISHEFRTPLTLILSPLEQFIQGTFRGDQQKYFRIMQRNGHRLLQLVNQLLDLSKLEGGRMHLGVSRSDLAAFVRAIAFSFESLAIRKQISLEVNAPESLPETWFDRDKLEKILTNLISNAFKFTPEGGAVSVSLAILNKEQVRLEVQDTGIGIPPPYLPFIFDRFYSQNSRESELGGTGIGLALTKELVELHRGSLEVQSQENVGTVFTLVLPVGSSVYNETEKVLVADTSEISTRPPVEEKWEKLPGASFSPLLLSGQKQVVLIVEDSADVSAYIRDQLTDSFAVLTAEHGAAGLEKALDAIPDLIITDLMMPEMDGMTLTQKLKTDERTSHIPVIMLTAKAEREDKLEGLQTGADDYLIKPFDAEELRVRVNNLIAQRRKLQARFRKEGGFDLKELDITSVDQVFLQRVLATIESEMEEETFSVVELSQAVGMSRSQLHRKLKALTGKSPNEIIREIRLQRAKELLEKGAGNTSEVAFMVGFNSLAYFSKCFKDAYGVSPSSLVG